MDAGNEASDGIRLNVDVMDVIMSHSDRETVSRLMKTCRNLNREGARYLLTEDPSLNNPSQVVSLVRFFKGEESRLRLGLLRGLSIEKGALWSDAYYSEQFIVNNLSELFVDIAADACNFERLKMANCITFFKDQGGSSSITGIWTLKKIELTTFNRNVGLMLQELQSRLVDVTILDDTRCLPQEDRDVLRLLRNSCSTLHTLTVRMTVFLTHEFIYPHMRVLTLERIWPLATRRYVHAFPGLEELRTVRCGGFDLSIYSLQSMRAENTGSERPPQGSWQSLRLYNGSLVALWALGIQQHIPQLRLFSRCKNPDKEPFRALMLRDVVVETRPTDLYVEIYDPTQLYYGARELFALFASPDGQSVHSLELKLWLNMVRRESVCAADATVSVLIPGQYCRGFADGSTLGDRTTSVKWCDAPRLSPRSSCPCCHPGTISGTYSRPRCHCHLSSMRSWRTWTSKRTPTVCWIRLPALLEAK